MKAIVIFHRGVTFGHPRAGTVAYKRLQERSVIDLRAGRKVIPGRKTMFVGLARTVLAVGWEPGIGPVVHLSR